MAHDEREDESVYHLARLALAGRRQDVLTQIQRLSRRVREGRPALAARLDALLAEQPTHRSPVRSAAAEAVPVDTDSRLQLARVEFPAALDVEPIWDDAVLRPLAQIVTERDREPELAAAGLLPTRSALFTGPPGVGKTLAARWLARGLGRPLLTLDLAAVMSSLLGRTGSNVRQVLDYAKGADCVLLLDELDAVAKRRDDAAEIGELKRLVTVLLQEIDDWPASGLLVAATNHPDLLDPAAWRRFDLVIEFPMPGDEQIRRAAAALLGRDDIRRKVLDAAVAAFRGGSFSDLERELLRARREAVVLGEPVEGRVLHRLGVRGRALKHDERIRLAAELVEAGLSQRQAAELTGVHRNTIKKAIGTD